MDQVNFVFFPDVVVKDKQGLTPLHYAAKKKEGGSAQVKDDSFLFVCIQAQCFTTSDVTNVYIHLSFMYM